MTVLIVIGAIVLVVAALLALDWVMAGRSGRRRLMSARDGEAGNANAGYAFIETQARQVQQKGPGG